MKILRKVLLLILTLNVHILYAQTDTRSDSLDILNYKITLSIRNIASKNIAGNTQITFKCKQNNIQSVRLDFLRLNITSVKLSGNNLTYTRNDSMVFVNLSAVKNIGDTFTLSIDYNGQPQSDPKWGGFYFSGNYAFNMGVGFVVTPHNFGRAWFPCFDNFTERSTYDLYITTDSGYKAVCGGLLISSPVNTDNSVTWNWRISTPIPTYLVSVSVSNYEFVYSSYNGILKNIPIILAAHASDTVNVKSSFVNLNKAAATYENYFGPYLFERIGYNIVPFSGGAMEHATNISYPIFAVQGTTYYETMMAHELSHHWFGDLATCRTEADMWLNEGWASYCEKLFLENTYGKQSYADEVKSNHLNVIRYAHVIDGDFRAVYGIPHQYTYGEHVYHKGADVIHTLRSYMGDSAFFSTTKAYLNQYQFKDVNTADMLNVFKQYTSADINSYFTNWIYTKGFPDFKIRTISTDGSLNTSVVIEQNLRATNTFYTNVPLTITFYDKNWNSVTKNFVSIGYLTSLNYSLPFTPVLTIIDKDEKISYARTKNTFTTKTNGSVSLTDGLMTLQINAITDSAMFNIEHHWTAANQIYSSTPGLYLSNYRYWNIDGIWPASLSVSGIFQYDGTSPSNFNGGYLDHTLIHLTEDSLRIVWRPNATSNWQIIPDSSLILNKGGLLDKKGSITVKKLQKGEYAFGMFDHTLAATEKIIHTEKQIKLYPNPVKGTLHISVDFMHNDAAITILDITGRKHLSTTISSLLNDIDIDISTLPQGIYFLNSNDLNVNKKFIVQ